MAGTHFQSCYSQPAHNAMSLLQRHLNSSVYRYHPVTRGAVRLLHVRPSDAELLCFSHAGGRCGMLWEDMLLWSQYVSPWWAIFGKEKGLFWKYFQLLYLQFPMAVQKHKKRNDKGVSRLPCASNAARSDHFDPTRSCPAASSPNLSIDRLGHTFWGREGAKVVGGTYSSFYFYF